MNEEQFSQVINALRSFVVRVAEGNYLSTAEVEALPKITAILLASTFSASADALLLINDIDQQGMAFDMARINRAISKGSAL